MKATGLLMKFFVYALAIAAAQEMSARGMGQQDSVSSVAAQSDEVKPQLRVQLGHSYGVNLAVFSGDSKYVLTMSGNIGIDSEHRARLWEVDSGREIRSFGGPTEMVRNAVFSPDSRYVLSVNWDSTAQLCEIATGKIRKFAFEGHIDTVYSATLSANNKYLLTMGFEGDARLWEVDSGRGIGPIGEHAYFLKSAIFSPDGNYLLTSSRDYEARLWEAKSGKAIRSFGESTGMVRSAVFSPDGKYVLTTSDDGTARLWEVDSGKEIKRYSGITSYAAFTPTGKYLVTPSNDGAVRLLDVGTGSEVRRFIGRSQYGMSAEFSPDGKYALTIGLNNAAQLWEVEVGNEVKRFEGQLQEVKSGRFSPDGKYLLSTNGSETPLLWDLDTGKQVRRFEGQSNPVASAVSSSDGKYLLTAGADNRAVLWDIESGKQVRRFEGHSDTVNSAILSSDNKFVLTASEDGTARLWSADSGKEVRSFLGHIDAVNSAIFSKDGHYVLTASDDYTARLWESASGKLVRAFGKPRTYSSPSREIPHVMKSAIFSPDGESILTISSDGTARLWGTRSGQEIKRFMWYIVNSAMFSADGNFLLSAGEKAAWLWDVKSGKEAKIFMGHSETVRSAVFSQDGKYILTASSDKTARLWDINTGKEVRKFVGHSDTLRSANFLSDGKYIITTSDDCTSRMWSIATGEELGQLISFSDGNWAVVTRDGFFDTSDLEVAKGLHWVMADDPLTPLRLEIYVRDYYTPLLLPRLLSGKKLEITRPLASLNRAQPIIKIIKTEQRQDKPEQVSVTVEATESEYKPPQGTPRKSSVYDLRLFRDGQLVAYDPKSSANIQAYSQIGKQSSVDDELKVWRSITEFKPDPKSGNTRTFLVSLPRNRDITEVEFSAYAFNDDRVKSETYRETYKLPRPLKASVKGKAYLITIGVAASEDARWNLFYPANDARKMQKEFYDWRSQQYDQVVRVPLVSDFGGVVKRFENCSEKKPTREAIRTVLDLLAGRDVDTRKQLVPCADQIEKANPEDLVVIYFSGHGYGDGLGNYYLFPYDTGKRGGNGQDANKLEGDLLNRVISSEELSAWMRDIDAGEFVMILDACQSEAATGAEFKPGPMGSRGLGQLAYDKGMRMIVATQADNQAVGSGSLSHGLLTYALLEGLGSKAGVKEWLERAAERVPKLYEEKVPDDIKKQSKPQQPVVFDFIRKAAIIRPFGNN